MNGGGLHAGKIECLVSWLLVGVCLFGAFSRNKLPDLPRESPPSCLILNTDPKDQPGTHWLALYAPKANPNEIFDSFSCSPIN